MKITTRILKDTMHSLKIILMSETMFDTAMDIAQHAHTGQIRRGDKSPYITHPMRVYGITQRFGYSKKAQIAAIVHDAIEDAPDPEQITDLVRRRLPNILPIVQAVTKQKGAVYLDYISKISGPALQVKLSDMLHNLMDAPSPRQKIKYRRALEMIHDAHGGVPQEINPQHWDELLQVTRDR